MSRSIVALVAVVLMLTASLAAAEPHGSTPGVVAHRGLLRHAPENTLANFRTCLELRIGFEVDVARSKDGHLVCVHDDTVNRTTNGRGRVDSLTLAQLKNLDAGGWFDARFRGQRIPTLDEVFALLAKYPKAPVLIAIDLKGGDPRIEADIVTAANKHAVLGRLLFIGRAISTLDVRRRLRHADPKTHVACVANNPSEFAASLADPDADWVYVRYLPSKAAVAKIHASGKHCFIAEGSLVGGQFPNNWAKATAAGVDAILTDYPLVLRMMQRAGK